MMKKEGIIVSWSSGKDSCVMLHNLIQMEHYSICSLMTMLRDDQRVSAHGVRKELLLAQAEALQIPIRLLTITNDNSYESCLRQYIAESVEQGVHTFAYGDLFLEDIRNYRIKNHKELETNCLFPIWGKNTKQLAKEIVDLGYKIIVTCVDTKKLDASFAGRVFDHQFIRDLPEHIDPCGENGEFHTFVYGGPIFRNRVSFKKNQTEIKEFIDGAHKFTFALCDLEPL